MHSNSLAHSCMQSHTHTYGNVCTRTDFKTEGPKALSGAAFLVPHYCLHSVLQTQLPEDKSPEFPPQLAHCSDFAGISLFTAAQLPSTRQDALLNKPTPRRLQPPCLSPQSQPFDHPVWDAWSCLPNGFMLLFD